MHTINLPIRYLTEFLLKSGSIDSRFTGLDRGAQGTRLHRKLQKQGGKGYKPEVALSLEIAHGNFLYTINGRADGVIKKDGGVTVDEIKTTAQPLGQINEDSHPEHWAQGMCYAHILCTEKKCAEIYVQLTYCHVDTEEVLRFTKSFTAKELDAFMQDLLEKYTRWAELEITHEEKRNKSLQALAFPFGEYREGQRTMAVAAYQTFRDKGRLFCCAPTGIGKTVSSLFPAMKALGEGIGGKIFYLTAKTTTRAAAEDAVSLMRQKSDIDFLNLTLTAKDKACFLEERACNPESCEWADGYYDRVNDAMYTLLASSRALGRDDLEAAAKKHRLCPYELSLDLALWCDCIICDYNYLFDPVVHLQRFFERKGEYLFLVDEAHNLVERSRDMYSATLRKSAFFAFKKELPNHYKRLHSALLEVNKGFVALRKKCEEENADVLRQDEMPSELARPLEKFCAAAEAFLEEHRGSAIENSLLEIYFEALFYQKIAEGYGANYITLIYKRGSDVTARLFCMDPSGYLEDSLDLGRAAIMFSATLAPLDYYKKTLGGGDYGKLLNLPSPFAEENLGLYLAGIDVRYANRGHSLGAVAGLIHAMAQAKTGKYMAFFPSYSYMQQVYDEFCEAYPDMPTTVQSSGMSDEEREDFLASFNDDGRPLLGFCVMGGVFAEGVDLAGNRLLGVAVVGVGLPQFGPEPDAVRDYYDEQSGAGFEYAYQYPGMNKVMQAAGRVIRTEEDRGVVLLIDSRFATPRYQSMFPQHWRRWQSAVPETLPQILDEFWAEK